MSMKPRKIQYSLLKTRWVFLLVFFLFYQTSFSQQSSIDSLENLLSQAADLKEKTDLYQALILEYKEVDPDKAIEYSDQVLKLLSLNEYEQRGKVYHYLGTIYTKTKQYEKALSVSDSALYWYERTGIDEDIIFAQEKKWNACRNLVVLNLYKSPDKATKYVHSLLKIAFKNNNSYQIGESYSLAGAVYSIKRQTERSFECFDSAIYYLAQTNSQKELARVYTGIGQNYHKSMNFKESSKWLYKGLEIYDSLNLPVRSASTLDALATIDLYFKDFPEAIKKNLRAIDIYKKSKFPQNSRLPMLNLGNAYNNAQEWEKAIPCFNEVIPLFKELKEYGNLIHAYLLKTDALKKTGQLTLAQESIKKALQLKEHAYNQVDLLKIYSRQAELFFLAQDYTQSITLFTMILDSAEQIPNLILQIEAFHGLIDNYKATNNLKKAFECSTKLLIVNDSLTARNNQKNIKDIEIKYETAKKEQENQLLLKEKELQAKDLATNKQRLYFSIGVAFLIFIISILVLRQYRTRAKATNNALKSRLLRNQMSPHFLFNSLVAIQSFVYTNNPIKAGDYLSSFATLMRAILDNSSKEYITLKKELQWLENYLSLQLLRFKDKFEYQVQVNEHIQIDNTLIPPMLIQPFIENALEHGLKNLDKKGLITINIQQKDGKLSITVKDNGLGMTNSPSTANKEHESRALSITKERLSFLNKKQAKKIDFDITSSPNNGTIVSFHIPFKSKF